MGSARDAHRPRRADVIVDRLLVQIVVEHDDALIAAIGDIDHPFRVNRDRVRRAELQGTVAARTNGLDEAAVLVELHDPRVAVAIGHEDVALRIEADVGLSMERVWPVGAWVLAAPRRQRQLIEWIGALAKDHQELAVGAELLNDVGALVDGPDVVVLVDAHGVSEGEAVTSRAEFLDERASLVELEQPRLAAPHEHEDVPLRIGGDAGAFAHVEASRELEEIGNRVERDLGRRGLRLRLSEGRPGDAQL